VALERRELLDPHPLDVATDAPCRKAQRHPRPATSPTQFNFITYFTFDLPLSSVFLHHLSQPIDGNCLRHVTVTAVHRGRPQNGIVDGFLSRFDRGLEKG
jgi:hypothetical protein